MARVNLITEDANGLVAASKLPLATSSTKGAVMPVAATAAMTQDVGVKADGTLVTEPGGGGGGGNGFTLCVNMASYMSNYPLRITLDDTTTIQFDGSTFTVDGTDTQWEYSRNAADANNVIHLFLSCSKARFQAVSRYDSGWPRPYVNGVSYIGNADFTVNFSGINNFVSYVNAACLSPSTLISTPTGTTVLSSLRDGDEILSVNERGEIVTDRVVNCDSHLEKYGDETDVWTFDDGTVLKTINPHEFFSADEQRFKYIADFRIGERIVKADGAKPALVKHEVIPGKARHMTLFTEKYNTYFANGVLTGNRHSVKFTKEM